MRTADSSSDAALVFDRVSVLLEGAAERPALESLSLTISDGESLLVAGADGAGKTTLLRLLAGLITPTRGALHQRVRDIAYIGADATAQVVAGTLAEDVAAGMEVRGVPRDVMRRDVPALLEAAGLEGRGSEPPAALSGGERQRLAAAAAVACLRAGAGDAQLPALLLADEPASQLDAGSEARLGALLDAWLPAHTIRIIASHDLATSLARNARLLALEAGRMAFFGSIRDFCAHPTFAERIGVAVPDPARVAAELADRDMALAGIPLSTEELIALARPGPST